MSLMIEEGKYYADASGDKIGPMQPTIHPVLEWRGYDRKYDCFRTYRNDGRFFEDGNLSNCDLAAEWVDGAHGPDVAKVLADALGKALAYLKGSDPGAVSGGQRNDETRDVIRAALALYRGGRP